MLATTLIALLVSLASHRAAAQPARLDAGFLADLRSGLDGSPIHALAIAADGRVLVAGTLRSSKPLPHPSLIRLGANGAIDPGFVPALPNAQILTVAIEPDGKILVGGQFRYLVGGVTNSHVARLESNGSLDPTFDPRGGANGQVRTLLPLPDGSVLVGGAFTTFGGEGRIGFAKLHVDGRPDTAFPVLPWTRAYPRSLARQADGSLVLLGSFSTAEGAALPDIARLRPDGSPDPAFKPDLWVGLTGMAVEPDGGILLATPYAGARVIRLDSHGARDTRFAVTVAGAASSENPPAVQAILRQPDGRLVIGGKFTSVNGTARRNLARLEADGRLDAGFDAGSGPVSSIDTLSYMVGALGLQPDGRLLVGGPFTTFSGQSRSGVVRLLGDPLPRLETARAGAADILVRLFAAPGTVFRLETSSDLFAWQLAGMLTNETGVASFSGAATGHGFYRAIAQ